MTSGYQFVLGGKVPLLPSLTFQVNKTNEKLDCHGHKFEVGEILDFRKAISEDYIFEMFISNPHCSPLSRTDDFPVFDHVGKFIRGKSLLKTRLSFKIGYDPRDNSVRIAQYQMIRS
jgi:hypothetical protein